ncbi:MAG TPA: prepilin-type N-terminal cleavage/methylation domain-containing protein [Candidatus Paceibacterota bacterium]|nr:prepilin-type N-terminal cleavage/methylation domain-containing protein [Candidatus Paceibacterota bacterium]
MSSIFIHSRRGQTLVEALVALSILTTGFIGIVGLLNKSFQLNRTTTDDTQATYLAAEGIEITKSLIDHDVYTGLAGGNNDFGACFPSSGYYYPIDIETTDCASLLMNSPNNPPNTPLFLKPNIIGGVTTAYLFTTDSFGAAPTDFVRNIEVVNNGNELDVQSTVIWTSGPLSNTITLEDHFYNWHP